MNINVIVEMAATGYGDRIALGSRATGMSFADLARRAAVGGGLLRGIGVQHLLFLGRNGPALPQALLAASAAGIPLVPLNYRLAPDRIAALIDLFAEPLVLVDEEYEGMLPGSVPRQLTREFLTALDETGDHAPTDPPDDDAAVLLFTSGTTSAPKIVPLSHGNLTSYLLETVDFSSAEPEDCALTATPPYHIAAIASVLSNLYAGRRVVYLPDFDAVEWLRLVRTEGVTSAMVVPTMLRRLVDVLDGKPADVPTLRTLSYGGSRAGTTAVIAAIAAFPDTGFVNAYGLTETSSTVALLGPDEHRAAFESDDPVIRARLGSVGRPAPGVEIEVRDASGLRLPAGERGELWLRGRQVSSRYVGHGSVLDEAGWFPTRDRAYVDGDGYLFIEGRLDDTIIRGGENIAPSEVEDVLRLHPAVTDVAVVGVADDEWGERMIAAVVRRAGATTTSDEFRAWARHELRGSRTPDDVYWLPELPYSPTGKLQRRELSAALADRNRSTSQRGR